MRAEDRPLLRVLSLGAGVQSTTLALPALVGLVPLPVDQANVLLTEWGHTLGPVHRPFRQEAYSLELDGAPVSVAVSASIVSATVKHLARGEVVELARLCTHPAHRWATRVMLRLWREVAAPRWACWPVRAAVAYSQTRYHDGHIYRFDGWRLADEAAGSIGGGSWSRRRSAADAVHGRKRLWIWEYSDVAA